MRILVSGSTGLIGAALVDRLKGQGHEIVRLTRSASGTPEPEIVWDPASGAIDRTALENLDAVVHLAGENLFGWWNAEKKQKIRDSRINGTALLAHALADLETKPRVLVSASAIGYYGDRGNELLDESSLQGAGFLAQVCHEWEEATAPASAAGIRVINTRFGIVLSPAGGALKLMLPVFKAGLGGPIGDGQNYMSWIAIEDACGSIDYLLNNDTFSGPVNIVAPEAVTNKEFTQSLATAVSRPAIFRFPKALAKTLLREMADEMLLPSVRVAPARLAGVGFQHQYPTLETALRAQLDKHH